MGGGGVPHVPLSTCLPELRAKERPVDFSLPIVYCTYKRMLKMLITAVDFEVVRTGSLQFLPCLAKIGIVIYIFFVFTKQPNGFQFNHSLLNKY